MRHLLTKTHNIDRNTQAKLQKLNLLIYRRGVLKLIYLMKAFSLRDCSMNNHIL